MEENPTDPSEKRDDRDVNLQDVLANKQLEEVGESQVLNVYQVKCSKKRAN